MSTLNCASDHDVTSKLKTLYFFRSKMLIALFNDSFRRKNIEFNWHGKRESQAQESISSKQTVHLH